MWRIIIDSYSGYLVGSKFAMSFNGKMALHASRFRIGTDSY